MKNCPNCQSEVEESYSLCWNCAYNFNTGQVEKLIDLEELENRKKSGSRKIDCLRCQIPMKADKSIRIDKGFNWGIFGDLGHMFTGARSFDLYVCPHCDKVEFFINHDVRL